MTIKNILTFLLIIIASQTQASWSGFAHVTPENQKKYGINVKVTTVKNKKSYKVEFNIRGSGHKHAWLVISSSPLTKKEQKLRSSIWFKKTTNKKIVSITKLKPSVKTRYKELLNISQIENGYIYIDFPDIVMDGGYYYSIDLNAYYLYHKKWFTRILAPLAPAEPYKKHYYLIQ